MTAEEVNAFLDDAFPQLNEGRRDYYAVEVHPGGCIVRLDATEKHLRPGDTVSGPCLCTLADIGGYTCALSHLGPVALAVTINLNINYMRKAGIGAVDAVCRIQKLGRRLMVFDCDIVAGPDRHLVAHATGTYSIPPPASE
jgi:uncharacterized protein (TIGR00369 family)